MTSLGSDGPAQGSILSCVLRRVAIERSRPTLPLRDRERAFCSRPVLRTSDEELFGVYGEHHLHLTARVTFFDAANRLVYALGAHFHPERNGSLAYLDEDPYHPV